MFLPLAPFWFLSFMPKALVTCGGKGEPACSWSFGGPGSYRALNHPPDDWNDWYNLVQVGPYLDPCVRGFQARLSRDLRCIL